MGGQTNVMQVKLHNLLLKASEPRNPASVMAENDTIRFAGDATGLLNNVTQHHPCNLTWLMT